MPANYTNQSQLRAAQGGSITNRGQNQRAQAYTRNNSPTTAYNTPGENTMNQPMNMRPVGGQYGNQQTNWGRYEPPMMRNGGWTGGGGYGYNLPNAFGSTGLNYMSGFDGFNGMFNPFMGYGGMDDGMGGRGSFGTEDAGPPADQYGSSGEQDNMRSRLGMAQQRKPWEMTSKPWAYEQYGRQAPTMGTLSENSLGGATRPPESITPINPWMSGGVQPMPNRMGSQPVPQQPQRAFNPFAGLPGGFGGG